MTRILITAGLSAFLLATALSGGSARAASPEVLETVQGHLYAGRTAAAAAAMHARLQEAADDGQARLALGVVQFIQAVEHLAQSAYRHGFRLPKKIFDGPNFRPPFPENPKPEPLTYEVARAILQAFVTDLARSERTLAAVADPRVKLPLDIGLVRLDMNADGKATEGETQSRIFRRITLQRETTETQDQQFVVDLNRAYVPWMRANCHLLMGLAEFLLAHDWHVAFEHTFHALFPRAGLPFANLGDGSAPTSELAVLGEAADLFAFVHLIRWPVAEAERLARSLAHLESMVALARTAAQPDLAGKVDADEPSPAWMGAIPVTTVTQDQVDRGLIFLDDFEALLQGRKLLPHWRLAQGINLRRVFLEPSTFDLTLWIQGSAAIPYLEDGELISTEAWKKAGAGTTAQRSRSDE